MTATTDYHDIRRELNDGDLCAFRGGGVLGRLYRYTHVELVKWLRNEMGEPTVVMLAGYREFQGARMVTLSSQVAKYPGRIDVFRPRCSPAAASVAAELMARQSGKKYNWLHIWAALLWHFMLLRFLFGWPEETEAEALDRKEWGSPKMCSGAIVSMFRRAVGQRHSGVVCGHRRASLCFPQTLADDSFFCGKPIYSGLVL